MSIRIHVVGAYGASEGELRAALDRIGGEGNGSTCFRIGSSGNWVWGNASVWQVGGADIDEALQTLIVPALRVTSSDGVLWMLTLVAPGKNLFRGVHHFSRVGSEPHPERSPREAADEDFPEDELEQVAGINRYIPELQFLWDADEEARLMRMMADEQAATVEGLDDYTDYGVTLPAAVIEEMRQNPRQADHIAFRVHAREIVEALQGVGLEFDQVPMLDLLTVGPLTDLERDSDVGNMPRFLRMLGIDGVFSEEPEEESEQADTNSAAQAEAPVDWATAPPGELFAQVSPLLDQCGLSDIEGGPVKVGSMALLHLLAHLCEEKPVISVLMEFPNEFEEPLHAWKEFEGLEVMHTERSWRLCFNSALHWWFYTEDRDDLESHDLARALGEPPEGTCIEFTFLLPRLAEQCHRYRGTYHHRCLKLEQAYPPVKADILHEALALIEQAFGEHALVLQSDQEESAVRREYQRDHDEIPRIRNGKVMPEPGRRLGVIRTLLFERFTDSGPWDIAGARQLVEEDWDFCEQLARGEFPDEADEEEQEPLAARELQEVDQLAEMLKSMNEAKAVPHSEEVLYEGRTGRFLKASMPDLPHLSQDQLQAHDAALFELGFHPIGDAVGDIDQRQEITRCYAGHRQAIALFSHRNQDNRYGWTDVHGGTALVDFSAGTKEFHTHFEDATSLVTTSIDAVSSKPEQGIFVRNYEDVPLEMLWEKHLDGIRRFQEHRHTVPIDHRKFNELRAFLNMMDRFFCRFLGQE